MIKSKNKSIVKSVNKKSKTKKGIKKVLGKIQPKEVPVVSDAIPIVVSGIPPKKRRAKKSSGMYFTSDTEKAIIEYNSTEDLEIRNQIYETKIRYSFDKLVENVFNTFKFTYFETSHVEVQQETVAHLVTNMNKFQAGKGKAFSYFSIIAKHYLIFHNNNNYKRFNQNVTISDTPSETSVCLQYDDHHQRDIDTQEFLDMIIEYWDSNVTSIFPKKRDLNIANAVIELLRNNDRIDVFNKKALYLYIREIGECKTQQITKVINKMKCYQRNLTKCYLATGKIKSASRI